MTKEAHGNSEPYQKSKAQRLQIDPWHFEIILLIQVFWFLITVFSGSDVEPLDFIPNVSKRSFSILKGIITTLGDWRYKSKVW